MEELESGYVPPENWERGINAFYTSLLCESVLQRL
ncbi:hypothetical protein OH693_09305 [Escherichia coli]|nr:hypothetical protein [Escherichia coli]